jgi:hypothetical protein
VWETKATEERSRLSQIGILQVGEGNERTAMPAEEYRYRYLVAGTDVFGISRDYIDEQTQSAS